ncbi:hypothetical protein FHT87_000281 [Rhizobium sp. BK316]|uniref:hypothetical protein n=1 Tax=Rhizobium sp. BK316 TaxID=2587053 RepID=UPI001617735B|nr:hypothetical protein [Rhizobium sp. BK316]MBB3406381.1 hypothetical protein [Rhizobium sp. BK316]
MSESAKIPVPDIQHKKARVFLISWDVLTLQRTHSSLFESEKLSKEESAAMRRKRLKLLHPNAKRMGR